MKLLIEQQIFTFRDRFTVRDEGGNDRYFVKSELFSWGKKLHVYDMCGNEVTFIRQEVFTFLPRYTVFIGDDQVAEIVKEFSLFFPRYSIEGLGWEIEGQFLEHDYEITQGGHPIVTIRKEWMTWGDCYELNISDPTDTLLALATVLTIDCVVEAQRN